MVSTRTSVSGKITQAPKPHSMIPSSTQSFKSEEEEEEEEEEYDDTLCEKCGSGECPEQLLLCDKCDLGFHLFCIKPVLVSVPTGSWFCPSCSSEKPPPSFPLVQTKIEQFFRHKKLDATVAQDNRKKRRRSSSLGMPNKRRKLLPFNPSKDPDRRTKQLQSLATALIAAGAEFSNKLTYVEGMAPRSANSAAMEKEKMQILSKKDTATLNLCNRMIESGACQPLMVVYDSQEGFTVEADRFIKDRTIITEYVGDVDYLHNREYDDGDSIMTLIRARDPSKSLVICPDKRSNIARFISGINNHTPEGKKKQNVTCARFNVQGECRVLLIAMKDIKEGERLYYNYNGSENEYPTEHFV